jgi:hypothetical protein
LLILVSCIFSPFTIHTTTEEKWLLIKTKIQEIIDKHVPSMTLRQKQDIPWLTPEIKRLIRKRERIYKKLKSTRVEERPNIIKKHNFVPVYLFILINCSWCFMLSANCYIHFMKDDIMV